MKRTRTLTHTRREEQRVSDKCTGGSDGSGTSESGVNGNEVRTGEGIFVEEQQQQKQATLHISRNIKRSILF